MRKFNQETNQNVIDVQPRVIEVIITVHGGHNSFKSNSKAYFNISLLQLGQRERLNGTMNCKRDLSLMGSKISRNLRPENGGLCENSLTFTQV